MCVGTGPGGGDEGREKKGRVNVEEKEGEKGRWKDGEHRGGGGKKDEWREGRRKKGRDDLHVRVWTENSWRKKIQT